MPIIDPYKQAFTNKGWICSTCGAWVPDGVLHHCAGKGQAYSSETVSVYDLLIRIKALEEEISKLKGEMKQLREELCKGE